MRKEAEHNLLQAELKTQCYHVVTMEPLALPAEELLYELRLGETGLEKQRDHINLEESRGRYTALNDFSSGGYLILTYEGLISEINPTAIALLGLNRKRPLCRYFALLVATEDNNRWRHFFSDVIKHNRRQTTGLSLKRDDGAVISVQLDCRPVMTGDKEQVLYIALTGITERKQEQAILHEVETHTLSRAPASAKMGTWDWDIATESVVFNERWAELRGYRLEDIDPHVDTWQNGIYPDDFPAYDAALTAHLEQRTPFFQAEYRIRTLAGPLIWILNRGIVIKRDSNGNPLRMAGNEMVITERKQSGEELLSFPRTPLVSLCTSS
jgi:PAS domain S-box-containing protein